MSELLGNLEELVAHVRRRAEQRALALESGTEAKAERIREEAEEQARALREEARERGRRAASEACRQRLAVADLERRRLRLESREARLERVWAAAREKLMRRAENGLDEATLARLARDAASRLGADEATIELDEASRRRLSADDVAGWAADDGPALRLDEAPLARGQGLVAHAGRASVDATLEGRLAQARTRLRSEVEEALTDPDAGRAAPPSDEDADADEARADDAWSDDGAPS